MLNRSQGCIAWMLIFVLSISCERQPQKTTEIIREVPSTTEQKTALELNLSATLQDFYQKLLVDQDKGAAGSIQAAELHIRKIKRTSPTSCDLSRVAQKPVQKCIVLEVVKESSSITLTDSEFEAKLDRELAVLEGSGSDSEILAHNAATIGMPYLSETFFTDRKFILTTSLQQGSVGQERVLNLDSSSVRLKVESGKLVVLKNPAGQFPATDAMDEIITSYPITRTVSVGKERYHQIDFSRPLNNHLYQTSLVGPNQFTLDVTADVIVPTVAHTAKSWNTQLESDQYFTQKDSSLVLDNLVLISGYYPGSDSTLGKDALRPTLRIIQGLIAETEADQAFITNQAITSADASAQFLSSQVHDLSQGEDEPFFTTAPFYSRDYRGQLNLVTMVKKFDSSTDTTFVLSRNTPPAAIPVIKAAVQSYHDLFQQPGQNSRGRIIAYSADEFAEHVRQQKLDIPEYPIAADPRVNMISWTDDDSLGAAWGTTLAHPLSGRIISGDVLMSGSLWARIGCSSYFSKRWAQTLQPKSDLASFVVPYETQGMWATRCELAMSALGIKTLAAAGPTNDPNAVISKDSLPSHYEKALNSSFGFDFEGVLKKKESKEPNSLEREWRLGSNLIRARPYCQRPAALEYAEATKFGAPGIDFQMVRSEKEAALAMVRAVTLHELGHLFGLRHNFAGSLASAKIDPAANAQLIHQSDSFMDYNDYGIDINTGSMNDYTSPEGARGRPGFGIYDIAALSFLYQLDGKALSPDNKASFCTDGNVKVMGGVVFGDCRPDDFGPDGISFALHNLNQQSLILRAVGLPLDPQAAAFLQQRLIQSVSELGTELFLAQEKLAVNTTTGALRETLIAKAKAITKGESESALLRNWSAFTGLPVIGLYDALEPKISSFQNENAFLRRFDALIARKISSTSFFDTLSTLANARRYQPGDAKFLSALRDLPALEGFNWNTRFKTFFRSEVIIPKGTAVEFQYFLNGKVMPGASAKYQGEPVQFILDAPTLNHNKVVIVKRLKVSDEEGKDVDIVATFTGMYNIDDLSYLAAFGPVVDPFAPATLQKLQDDRKTLSCMIGRGADCPPGPLLTDLPYTAAQRLIGKLNLYEEFLANPDF